MPNYHRRKIEGGCYFFTVVTAGRRPLLCDDSSREILREVWLNVKSHRPFTMIAFCLMPDHLHCIWQLPENDSDYSGRWSQIKTAFTRKFLAHNATHPVGKNLPTLRISQSRISKREQGVWQRRFWEHHIRGEVDLARHIDYIHTNPIKHGLVEKPEDWPWSTYKKHCDGGRKIVCSYEEFEDNYGECFKG
ncbi:MAG: hypothetical protein A2Y07_09690 [Planctomycetes bacterium GWF2_50_10]|nr:MAG: hypothetical protein A2Y07_09690 [Planctomycetes bacterium GWF2_50_10]